MNDVIRTWDGLGQILGKSPKALHIAWKRGKLPLTEQWDKGCRVFDKQEVEEWISRVNAQKQQ